MPDSQVQKLIESVVVRVFDRRISEFRKDLHRGVDDSLGSRVSELQLDVETGVAEIFNARLAELRAAIEAGVSEALADRAGRLRQEVDKNVGDVIQKRTGEVREQVGQGVIALIDDRVADLHRGLEEAVESAMARRAAELRKELRDVVQEVAGKRISNLRREVERVIGEKTDDGIENLRTDVAKSAGDTVDWRISDLRKDAEKMVAKTADDRIAGLRKDVERIVAEVAEKRVASIRKDVERVVAGAGEHPVTELRKEVVSRVAEEIERAFSGKTPEIPASTLLDSAVVSIQESTSQSDILRALLDGAAYFADRVSLFVVKGEFATGWQARGLEDNGVIRSISLGAGSGVAARAIESRTAVNAEAADFDSGFVEMIGPPADGNCVVLPLMVRDRVPALIYADGGSGVGRVDPAALQLLVRSAGLWLEVVTLRKMAGEGVAQEDEHAEMAAVAAASAPSTTAPTYARSAASLQPKPVNKALSAEEEEIHKKARRFAKLLVDEIKLYNQSKVAEGRQHRDLYDRLREDIEKSRASYEKRYGGTAAASGDYFNQEIIRILAENDASVLGSNFPQ
jgi:hypothetical protein